MIETKGAYARTREGQPATGPDLLALELFSMSNPAFLASARLLQRAARRRVWHSLTAYRCASISRVLRLVERILGDKYHGRHKVDGGWVIEATVQEEVHPVVRVVLPSLRRVADFKSPIQIIVVRPDLIDVAELQAALSVTNGLAKTSKEKPQ